ncbi:hypothetical protein CSKR_105829 [Clonorchis sinensis]|uniref:Uncharacterized protein n=2 Tax=Clonorchis sinensis TaxID=79923 RepID=G7Y5K3_CLOSI|nr:hypothetical protein CSKR_105829 [Clonorchis sinensis]GAA48239.1 hypothetical protein CLF_101355 [Clonorchis sinensis]
MASVEATQECALEKSRVTSLSSPVKLKGNRKVQIAPLDDIRKFVQNSIYSHTISTVTSILPTINTTVDEFKQLKFLGQNIIRRKLFAGPYSENGITSQGQQTYVDIPDEAEHSVSWLEKPYISRSLI